MRDLLVFLDLLPVLGCGCMARTSPRRAGYPERLRTHQLSAVTKPQPLELAGLSFRGGICFRRLFLGWRMETG